MAHLSEWTLLFLLGDGFLFSVLSNGWVFSFFFCLFFFFGVFYYYYCHAVQKVWFIWRSAVLKMNQTKESATMLQFNPPVESSPRTIVWKWPEPCCSVLLVNDLFWIYWKQVCTLIKRDKMQGYQNPKHMQSLCMRAYWIRPQSKVEFSFRKSGQLIFQRQPLIHSHSLSSWL